MNLVAVTQPRGESNKSISHREADHVNNFVIH